MVDVKIVRGYYLTAVGQESLAYHFKLEKGCSEYETVKAGDIVLSFYQNYEAITSLPALVRVDGVIATEKKVTDFLRGEKKDRIPMLPVVGVYSHFDPLKFQKLMAIFNDFKNLLEQRETGRMVQGELFDFSEEELV